MFAIMLICILAVLFTVALPVFPYSRQWSYLPPGGIGLMMLVVVVLFVQGRL